MKKKDEKRTAREDYLALAAELLSIRARHHGRTDSLEEKVHQEVMDKAWAKLNEAEVREMKKKL